MTVFSSLWVASEFLFGMSGSLFQASLLQVKPMRLLVYEDICGGGCAGGKVPVSLRNEGLAMLEALLSDLSELSDHPDFLDLSLVTLWDPRLGTCPLQRIASLKVIELNTNAPAGTQFRQVVDSADAVLVIAPEWDRRLESLCQLVIDQEKCSLNASPSAIALCADKLQLCQHLQHRGIRTIPTLPLSEASGVKGLWPGARQIVVKPRDGAGSQGVVVLPNEPLQAFAWLEKLQNFICQPFVSGMACSVACFVAAQSGLWNCLPIALQHLSTDGQLRYLGGESPAGCAWRGQVVNLVEELVAAIPGLNGYFGVDLILDEQAGPIVIEVNPRLTTSYVGYRGMTNNNLGEYFLRRPSHGELLWSNSVQWRPQGIVATRALTERELECCRN